MDADHHGHAPAISGFAKVACADCSNEQVVFLRASTAVTCQVCGAGLATPGGGVAELRGEVIERLD